jgi:hypothetical protein
MLRYSRFSLFALALLFLITSCDFNAASDAADDFDVLIGLPSLSTVVNVQALDASDGTPISGEVKVTFDGTDAASVVDIYSDPVSELNVEDGFGTFALNPSESPSSDPAQVTLRAQAPEYNATSTSIQVTQEGTVSRVIRLTSDDPRNAAPGTAIAGEDVSGGASGGTGPTTSSAAPSTKSRTASASFDIPAGIDLETASGESLTGFATMDLTVFDNSAVAQDLLPSEVKTDENGNHRQIRGAVRFEVRGDNGSANRFGTTTSDTTRVTADFAALDTRTGDPTVTLVNPATGVSRTVDLAPANTGRTETEFVFNGSEVIVRSPNGTGTIDRSSEAPQGEFFAVVGVDPTDTCSPGGLTIDPNGQDGSIRLQIAGDGFVVERTASIPDPQSSFTLSTSTLYEGEIPNLSSVSVSVQTTDDQTTTSTIDPCTESSITLDPPADNRIDATVRVEANCPEGERVPISPPFDGYSLSYRLEGNSDPYWTVPKKAITINTTDDAKETVTSVEVSLFNVIPDGRYTAVGTYGDQSANLADAEDIDNPNVDDGAIIMPSQDGGQITITDEELQNECK